MQPFAYPRTARGAAALPVVIVLLLVMGTVFFYANRGLIFEQRSSANQYRYTQAFEIADAGLNWALSMLNMQKNLDANCAPTNTTAGKTFKNNYITINTSNGPNFGMISPAATGIISACTVNADGSLACSCPAAGTAPTPPNSATAAGHFSVEVLGTSQPGSVQVVVRGCTGTGAASADPRCITNGSGTSDGHAIVSTQFGQIGGLSSPPVSTLSIRSNVSISNGASVAIYNTDPASNGITIDSGGTVSYGSTTLGTVPGSSPADSVISNDTTLSSISGDQMFQSFFNMSKADYKKTAYVLNCPSACSSTTLQAAYDQGARSIWVEGEIDAKGNLSFGSTSDPITLVSTGNASFSANTAFYGLVYVIGNWTYGGTGNGLIRGAAVTEGTFTIATGSPQFVFDPAMLRIVRTALGGFTPIPGSWRDWR